jgi:hypothetical protein
LLVEGSPDSKKKRIVHQMILSFKGFDKAPSLPPDFKGWQLLSSAIDSLASTGKAVGMQHLYSTVQVYVRHGKEIPLLDKIEEIIKAPDSINSLESLLALYRSHLSLTRFDFTH